MRKIREVLRMRAAGQSTRAIARSCNIAHSTVVLYLRRAEQAGLSWPLGEEMDEGEVERLLFKDSKTQGRDITRPVADWTYIHKELRRKAVTLKLLWTEYRRDYPDGYRYTQFCEHYRRWAGELDVCMRHIYKAGEKLFVDYAGMTVPVIDAASGQTHEAQIFVGALGASHYLYAEATRTQQSPDWIQSHIRCYEYMDGVAEVTVPDNTKTGVTHACRYDPDLNATYRDFAEYYGTVVIPTRPRKPKDKPKAETGVQIVEREILAVIRNETFFSFAQLNRRIRELLEKVNDRPMQKLGVSRRELYLELDRPALKPLPQRRYEYADFRRAKVNIDYHIVVDKHLYSVPYQLVGQQGDVRITARMVEALYNGKRVACHVRDDTPGGRTTDPAHMPKSHREHLEWTPSRMISWASTVGPNCAEAAQAIIENAKHPELGYRGCLGLIRLARVYDKARVDAACRRALALDVCSYRSIQSILKSGKDSEPLAEERPASSCRALHENVRGRAYYAQDQRQGVGG